MNNSRRFTLAQVCVISGVVCIFSCLVLPRIIPPAIAGTAKVASEPLASGEGIHVGKRQAYASTSVSVRPPHGDKSGHINLVVYNNTTSTQPVLISEYAVTQGIVIDRITTDDKSVKVAVTQAGVEARFVDIPAGERRSASIDFHYAQAPATDTAVFTDLTPQSAAEMAHHLDVGEPI